MAYLVAADLSVARAIAANLTNAELSQASLGHGGASYHAI